MFYFAYGSSMEHRHMQECCPGAKFVGLAILDGYWLVFDSFSPRWGGAMANITPSAQDEVWGGLYEIADEDIAKIDNYEGYPKYYKRSILDVLRPGREGKIKAWVYFREPQADGVPSRRYQETLIRGARDCGIPEDYIASMIDVVHRPDGS